MILQTVRQQVRSKLDDMEFDGNKVDMAINWFIFEILNNNRIRFMEDDVNVPITQGDIDALLPPEIQTATGILAVIPGTQPYSIFKHRFEHGDFMEKFADFSVATPTNVREFCFYGNKIRFAAPVLTGGNLFIEFVKRPTLAVADTDVLLIPDNYNELVVKGAVARVMEMNEDYAEADQERQTLEPLVTAFIRNEGRGSQHTGPTIMRSNRRGRNGEQ